MASNWITISSKQSLCVQNECGVSSFNESPQNENCAHEVMGLFVMAVSHRECTFCEKVA